MGQSEKASMIKLVDVTHGVVEDDGEAWARCSGMVGYLDSLSESDYRYDALTQSFDPAYDYVPGETALTISAAAARSSMSFEEWFIRIMVAVAIDGPQGSNSDI